MYKTFLQEKLTGTDKIWARDKNHDHFLDFAQIVQMVHIIPWGKGNGSKGQKHLF